MSDDFIIYNTEDGKASIALYADVGDVWLSQQLLAELFDTSKQNISLHIQNIFEDNELDEKSVVKDYLKKRSWGMLQNFQKEKAYQKLILSEMENYHV